MILKGSQRGNGADLAVHLMNSFDNESVEIAEVYGAVAGDLAGAFAEFEAVASGTRATQYLYSLSINPSAPLTREEYNEAIALIEGRLGLEGQPRAIVFHVKKDKDGIGREHCHVVWSRIDVEKMRAVHMAHDRRKLMDLACELAAKFGLELPPGLKAWQEQQKREKEKLEPTLAENAQEQASGISPEERRAEITAAYEASDSAEAFRAALEQKGYVLARGDRRGLVVVDERGDVHSLSRYIKGHTAKQIRSRLSALEEGHLPSVDEAKEIMRRRAQAQEDRLREQQQDQQRRREQERREELRREKEATLRASQAARRLQLQQDEQEVLTRHQHEQLSLHAAQESERRSMLFRFRSAVADLIGRTPGLRSVLAPLQRITNLDPKERHKLEREALARRHARERREIERRKRALARVEKREQRALDKAVLRELRLEQATRLEAEAERVSWQAESREWKYGDLRDAFGKAARPGEDAADGGDEALTPGWTDGDLQAEFDRASGFNRGGGGSGDGGAKPDGHDGPDDDDDGPPGLRHGRRQPLSRR